MSAVDKSHEERIFAAAELTGPGRIVAVRAVLLDEVAAKAIAGLDNDGGDGRMARAIDHHISGASYSAPEVRNEKHWLPLLSALMTDAMHTAATEAMS